MHLFDLKWKGLLVCLVKVFILCKSEEVKCNYLVNCKEFSERLKHMKFRPKGKRISIVVQSTELLNSCSSHTWMG